MSMFGRSSFRRGLGVPLLSFLIFGCAPGERNGGAPIEGAGAGAAATAPAAAGERPVVLFLGTSLTAGFGLDPDEAYPARIQEKVDSAGLPFEVVNAGVSGETSAQARRRLEGWLIRQPFDVLVIETGANDMLRGADLDSARANVQAMVDTVRAARPGAAVVLAGMLAPPNLGRDYAERYRLMYVELAERNGLPLIPFLLEGVGGDPEMNLQDGIHPNARGQGRVAENVWETLAPVLRERSAAAR
jgi:acyl-CoA thioesterase I